jgi:polyisoprenoid-binding protein YceI
VRSSRMAEDIHSPREALSPVSAMARSRVDEATAECLVFTQREGLLAAMGHDLVLRVTRFAIEGDPEGPTLEARFDAASLRVDAAVRDGRPLPDALGTRDRQTIEKAIAEEVLDARAHPEIHFAATAIEPAGEAWSIRGPLALHGAVRPVAFSVVRAGERLVAEVRLHQPDFGIRPYRALLGALAVKPDVTVRVTLPAAAVAR